MFAFAPGGGPFWPAGEVEVDGGGAVDVHGPPAAALGPSELLGVERTTWLGTLAATRPGEPEQIPLADACGRYVDWYETGK